MKLSEKSQILLERYLLAVERRLPLQGRKDMIAEIEANFLDKLEDTFSPEDVLTDSQLEAELRKFGSPKSVAASYRLTDNLIGPQHNAIFNLIVTLVVPIVVAVVFFSGLLSFVVSGGETPFWSFWGLIGTMWQTAVGIIGTAAIIFMVLTRFYPHINEKINLEFMDDQKNEWKVSELPEPVKASDRLHIWEPIAGIVVSSFILVIFLFLFDELVGFWWFTNNQWHMVPVFTDAIKAFIPMICIKIGLDIVLYSIQLYQHRHSLLSRWFEVLIKGFEITIVGLMLNAGTLITFNGSIAIENGLPLEGVEGLNKLFQYNGLHWFLVFLVVVLGIDLVKKTVQAVRKTVELTN